MRVVQPASRPEFIEGSIQMKFRVLVATSIVGGAVLLAGSAVATAASAKTVPFKGSYAGRAIVRASGDTAALSATGVGTGTVIGKGTLTGTGIGANQEPCPVFSGKGTMTGKTGRINFTVMQGATSCPGASDSDPNVLKGTVKVVGGTGVFKTAKGTLTLGGTYSRATGKYAATFSGKLTM
jgi:hypothetical protein